MKKRLLAGGTVVVMDAADDFRVDLAQLMKKQVLVGVPDENADRKDDNGIKTSVSNAALAYIHDNGAPELGIPARPFMRPGIDRVRSKLTQLMADAGLTLLTSRLQGNPRGAREKAMKLLNQAGMLAASSIRSVIDAGIPPPLKTGTLKGRLRRAPKRKGERAELLAQSWGQAPSNEFVTPLVDTGEMRKSITYVIRDK